MLEILDVELQVFCQIFSESALFSVFFYSFQLQQLKDKLREITSCVPRIHYNVSDAPQ